MKDINMVFPISVIVPTFNSETTLAGTIDSILEQKYPIREIIVVDNHSADSTVKIARSYERMTKKVKISVYVREKNMGVGASYNLGAEKARAEWLVFINSDSTLPTNNEMRLLTKPMRIDPTIVASYSSIILPYSVWGKYNFWEKSLLATSVGKELPGFNAKFDCVNKHAFLSVGGFDDLNFGHNIGIGGEDGDLHVRLGRIGKIVKSDARVVHLHYLRQDYTFDEWIKNRKLLARSYGRLLRVQGSNLGKGVIFFVAKLLLALIGLLYFLFPINFLILLAFAIISLRAMYTWKENYRDYRILLLPFITVFLVYYESFWMIESFLYIPKVRKVVTI
jgi:glycosyltransferase involved in cell wall biosynthesis